MIIDGVDFVIGCRYLIDEELAELKTIEQVANSVHDDLNVHVRADFDYIDYSDGIVLFWGKTDYYEKVGWHGENGTEDEDGNVIVNADPILALNDKMRSE